MMNFTRPFGHMLEGLPEAPVIVEVGCAHAPEGIHASSQGWSSLAFARHVLDHGGVLHSIDVDVDHLVALKGILNRHAPDWAGCVTLHRGDGEAVIRGLHLKRIDFLYIDGGVGGTMAAQQVASALLALRAGFGRVAFDDCPCDDLPEHWSDPDVRVSTVWANPSAHGLVLEWRDSVCVSFRAIKEM